MAHIPYVSSCLAVGTVKSIIKCGIFSVMFVKGFSVILTLESKVIRIIFLSVTLGVSLSNDLKLLLGPAGMFHFK